MKLDYTTNLCMGSCVKLEQNLINKQKMKTINYKGRGEHSVNELELIISQQAEELHLLKSGQKQLPIHGVVVALPSKNSKEFKGWLKSEGYKNKGFGIYQKENKDYCYTILYKHYCNVIEFGN